MQNRPALATYKPTDRSPVCDVAPVAASYVPASGFVAEPANVMSAVKPGAPDSGLNVVPAAGMLTAPDDSEPRNAPFTPVNANVPALALMVNVPPDTSTHMLLVAVSWPEQSGALACACVRYVNWSAELVALVPFAVVTVTLTTPGADTAGAATSILVSDTTTHTKLPDAQFTAVDPKLTAVAPVNPLPLIPMTTGGSLPVPLVIGPDVLVKPVTTGAAAAPAAPDAEATTSPDVPTTPAASAATPNKLRARVRVFHTDAKNMHTPRIEPASRGQPAPRLRHNRSVHVVGTRAASHRSLPPTSGRAGMTVVTWRSGHRDLRHVQVHCASRSVPCQGSCERARLVPPPARHLDGDNALRS